MGSRTLESLTRLANLHGHRFDHSRLALQFVEHHDSKARIEVRTTYPDGTTYTRRGTVAMTTGYQPVFILMPRSDSQSSSDTLGPEDEVVRIIPPWWSRRRTAHLPCR